MSDDEPLTVAAIRENVAKLEAANHGEVVGVTPSGFAFANARRLVVVESGGDWSDASYVLLELKPGVDLAAEQHAYEEWNRERFRQIREATGLFPGIVAVDARAAVPQYESFDERLLRLGLATSAVHEVVHPV